MNEMPSNQKIPFLSKKNKENFGTINDNGNPFVESSMVFDENDESASTSSWKSLNKFKEVVNRFLHVKNKRIKEFFAEFFGTFIFLAFSFGSVAQFMFSGKKDFLSVNISFGFGLTMAIIAVGKISGAHLNPAVSFSMVLLGKLSILQFIVYIIAQFIGAFLASVSVYLAYIDSIKKYESDCFVKNNPISNTNTNMSVTFFFDGGCSELDTAGIFTTFPDKNLNTFGAIFDQLLATSLFLISILAITDKKNTDIPHQSVALLIGLSLVAIGAAFGFNSGFAVNPARDFAPRVFTAIAGWGSMPFKSGNYYFWIPLTVPFLGSLVATASYHFLISNQLST